MVRLFRGTICIDLEGARGVGVKVRARLGCGDGDNETVMVAVAVVEFMGAPRVMVQ